MLQTSLETRLCIAWEIPIQAPCRSSTFHIENEQFYLQLNFRTNCIDTYGLVINRESNSRSFQEKKSLKVSVLFENQDGRKFSDVKSETNIVNYPQTLCNFNTEDVRRACTSCRSYYNKSSSWNTFKIVCLFHGNFTSIFQPKEKTDLSTRNDSDFSPNLKSLSLDLTNLLKNETLSDVKLKCGNDIIAAHRSVLAARSEVFAAMFQNKMSESNTGDVNIIDMEAPMIKLLLKYMYAGQISGVSDDVLPGLYAAADKYAVLALKESCCKLMIKKLSNKNCIDFLILSDTHNDADFKKSVINFICKHEEILEEETWLNFADEHSKLSIEVYKKYVEHKRKRN